MFELKQTTVAGSCSQAGQRPPKSMPKTTRQVEIELQVKLSTRSWLAHKHQRKQVEADKMNERMRQRARTRIDCELEQRQQVSMDVLEIKLKKEFSEERNHEPKQHQKASRGRVMGPQLDCDEKFDASSGPRPSIAESKLIGTLPIDRNSQLTQSSEPMPRIVLYIKRQQPERVKLIALFSLLTLGLVFSGRPISLPWNKMLNCNQMGLLEKHSQSRVEAVTCDTNGNHRERLILLASAEGAPEIGSHRTYWRRNQQIGTKTPANIDSDQLTEDPNELAPIMSKIPIPEYTQRPEPNLRLREGSSQLLRCATKEKMKNNYWMKDGSMLFDITMKSSDAVKAARFQFVGDMTRNDYTIELRNAQLEDSGYYECHSYTRLPDAADPMEFLVASNVTIEPIPPITQSPSALASLAIDHNIEVSTQQQQQQLQHSQRSTILTQPFQAESTLQPSNLIQPPPHMTRLISAPRPHQARNSSTTSLKMDPRLSMPFVWPYVLLALAAILMLTNVYLIYSLIRRHTRRRRSDVESPSRERKLSSSSSSGVGSGSGQGSTSVHRLTK